MANRTGNPNELVFTGIDESSLKPTAPTISQSGLLNNASYIWDSVGLAWIKATGGAAAGSNVTVTNFPSTQAVTAASLPLPAGASTETTLAALNTKFPAQGQALAAASIPVVLPATQITTLTPPAAITGFALEAGHLATIDTSTARIPAQGQALAAASLPVVLPAAQITTLTPLSSVGVNNFPATQAISATQLPAALGQTTKAASLPVTVASDQGPYTDQELGLSPALTALRDQQFAQRYTVLADSIADGFANFWSFTNTSGGTSAVSVGEGLVQTTATNGGLAQMVSTAPVYYPGQVAWLNSAIRFGDTGVAGSTLRIGACTVSGTTPQDGFYYELNGTTLNAVTVKSGVTTTVASTSWSKVASYPFTLDTNYHQFEIRWTSNRADFLIDNVLRHTASGGASSISGTLNFPIFIQASNVSAGVNRLIAVRNIGIGRFGTPDTQTVNSLQLPSALGPSGGVKVEVVSAAQANIDSDQYDDDGYRYVNPNVPGADIATGDKQTAIINALAQLLTSSGALGNIQSIASPITVAAVNSIPLAANAAVENGNLQKVADLMEKMLAELQVISSSIAQLQGPQVDGADQLRNDFTLLQ